MTLTVFGTGPNDGTGAPIKVYVNDLATSRAVDVIVRLNPNPNNPPPVASADSGELHGATVSGPFVQSTVAAPWKNPSTGNPGPGNPGPGNNTLNPGPGNPGPGNTGFTDYTDVQYLVKTEDATNTVSAYSTFVNITNPDSEASHFVQMIISHTLTTPSADSHCVSSETPVDEIVSTIPVPGPGNPGPGNPGPGNPGPGNPGPGNPGPGNPGPGNPGPGNNTFALAPAASPAATSAAAAFRASAVASAMGALVADQNLDIAPDGTLVASLPPDQRMITVRYWHCTNPAGCTVTLPDGTTLHFDGEIVTPGGSGDPVNRDSVATTTSANAVPEAGNTNILNDAYPNAAYPNALENHTLNVGDPLASSVQGVLLNDTAGHGGTLIASLFGNGGAGFGPFNGTATVYQNGSFTYTPNANFNGSDTFIYQATESASGSVSASTALARVTITIKAVNSAPSFTASNPPAVNEDAGPQVVSSWATFFSPGPSDEGSQTVLAYHIISNSNPGLFAAGPSIAKDGTLTYTPAPNANGTATIQVTVQDNGGTADGGIDTSAPATFTITINPVNDAPTISNIPDKTINWNTSTGAIPFTIGDVETAAANLIVSGSSSNTTLVPNANIVFGGSGANRTVTVTPAPNQSGNGTIAVTVTDGNGGNASDPFLLTVNQVNYSFVNVQNAPPPSGKTFKAGSAIPMQWRYANGSVVVNSSQVSHTVTVRGPLPSGPIRTITNTDPGSSSFRYDALTNTWQFNLQTKETNGQNYLVGTYDVTITPTTPGYSPSPTFQIKLVK